MTGRPTGGLRHLGKNDPRKKEDWPYVAQRIFRHDTEHASKPHVRLERPFPHYIQGNQQSCTSNALMMLYRHERWRRGMSDFDGARQLLYAQERIRRGNFPTDDGASLGDGLWVMDNLGIGPEADWAYRDDAVGLALPADIQGRKYEQRVRGYYRMDHTSPRQVRSCLGALRPFAMMLKIYESFEDATNGVVPMPDPAKEQCVGLHALYFDGHEDGRYNFLNSWAGWGGAAGGGSVPAEYLHSPDLASSGWLLGAVS